MAGPWPSNTALPTTNLDADTDTVTGAGGGREQLFNSIVRLNSALSAIDSGATPYTTSNPDNSKADKAGAGFANQISILDSQGNPISSCKTHVNTLGTTNATVPTSLADKTYVDNSTPPATLNVTGVCLTNGTIAQNTGIASVVFNANSSQSYAIWTINFVTPFADDNYLVLLTAEDSFGQYLTLASTTTTSLTVHDFDADAEASGGSSANSSNRIHIAIIGTV